MLPSTAGRMPAPSMRRVALPAEGLETLFGSFDENLRQLEAALGVRLKTSGSDVVIEGAADDVPRAEHVISQLAALLRDGYRFTRGDVKTAAQLIAQNPDVELQEFFLRNNGKAIGRRQVMPKTVTQRKYLEAIERCDIVFGVGPAGTGKTYLAMAQAVAALLAKRVTRIILARPAVEAGEKLGFLPGDLQEKVNPYLRPLYDALYDMLDVERVERLIERNVIEVAPLAFMRGRTLNDAFVILDEAQNTTSEQMKMFLTRLGFGSKAVVTGDITQIDLPAGKTSGLIEALGVVGSIEGIATIYFDDRDVVRHGLVQQIVRAYDAHAGRKPT
jgi:phosphate starvation-inducible PhoH-like protein